MLTLCHIHDTGVVNSILNQRTVKLNKSRSVGTTAKIKNYLKIITELYRDETSNDLVCLRENVS